MTAPTDVVRDLYEAVAAGDADGIAERLAPQVRWQGRARGVRWRRRQRMGCAGARDATRSMLVVGRKLPTVHARTFQAEGERVMVGLWADTMDGTPARWWSVLTVRGGQVAAIEDHTRQRDAVRALHGDTITTS
jgi:ketosteroid isomerase-like protein